MGPRLVSRGNTSQFATGVLEVVASMGPRLVSRGNIAGDVRSEHALAASMGPRLVSRGNCAILLHTVFRLRRFNGAAAC